MEGVSLGVTEWRFDFNFSDEYEEYEEETPQEDEKALKNIETDLVENDADPDSIKNKGCKSTYYNYLSNPMQ